MSKTPNDADVSFITALAQILNDSNLAEVSVKRQYSEDSSIKVRLLKHPRVQAAPGVASLQAAPAMATPASTAEPPSTPADSSIDDLVKHPGAVPSPMVGTCYLAPEPGAATFTNIGSSVTEGQTVLIIEAMKTMNHIPAPRSGVVKRILVEDGTPVEYGTPLMIIE